GENTFTIVYSGPYVNDNNEGDFEGTGIFTFDANGAPLSYDVVFKMRTGESSAEAFRFFLDVKETRPGTTAFEQVVAYESRLWFFENINFGADVDEWGDPDDYEEWTTDLDWVWDEIEQVSLLREETVTVTENNIVTVVGKTMYYYNSDNLLELILEAEDGENFNNAEWFRYDDADNDFPGLPVESRCYYSDEDLPTLLDLSDPDYYDYDDDISEYGTGEDYKYICTANDDGLRAEEVVWEAWESNWTASDMTTWTYDSSGVPIRVDHYEWDEDEGVWVHGVRFEGTISGNASSILDISSLDEWIERAILPFF
ncbi:MAG: hypothetical protein KAV87_68310, partial [Desulfobacteraceae bacterium]|nr:hypothetical protein [Desulfobacteraceae bacterium]